MKTDSTTTDPTEELGHVALEIARLLTQPRYDEAELAELDVRAKELRARVSTRGNGSGSEDWLAPPRGAGYLTSGG